RLDTDPPYTETTLAEAFCPAAAVADVLPQVRDATGPARDLRPPGGVFWPGENAVDGANLFRAVVRDQVAAHWDQLLRDFPRQGTDTRGRRLILEIQAEELRRLPWEGMAAAPVAPALDPGNALTRGPIDPRLKPAPCDGPVRVLVVVGSKPGD